jgi:hypothetical protein
VFISIGRSAKMTVLALSTAAGLAVALNPLASQPAMASTVVPAFISSCQFTQRAQLDPIVMPGMTGMAMLHDFFGNTATDANSTPASLLATGGSSCTATKDKTAYWTPTVSVNGAAVTPTRMRIYYRAGTKNPATVKPIPAGLKMIAGSAFTTGDQPTSVVSWGCGQASTGTVAVPTCATDKLVMHVYFPDCWDGTHLDSTNHQSHMAYTHNGACPADHPVGLPKVTEDVQYPIRGGSAVQFVYSGNARTGHADFMNGWNQSTMNSLVTRCIVGRVACGVIAD